jgi:hypothetical protein
LGAIRVAKNQGCEESGLRRTNLLSKSTCHQDRPDFRTNFPERPTVLKDQISGKTSFPARLPVLQNRSPDIQAKAGSTIKPAARSNRLKNSSATISLLPLNPLAISSWRSALGDQRF